MATTIEEIAQKAGVSKATVSRVLNGLSVKFETEQRVKAMMEKMDYRPHRFARGLATHQTGFLGVVTPTLDDPYVASVLSGMERESRRLGRLLIISVFHPDTTDEKEAIQTLTHPPLVDGVLFLLPTQAMEVLIDSLIHKKFPLVAVGEHRFQDKMSSIIIDNVNGAKQATQYLLGKGHRRIGFIKGKPELSDSADRLEGYREALKEAGIAIEEDLILPGNYEVSAGAEAADRFLAMKNPPSAVFASNDRMALGLLNALRAKGKAGSISVMGFDDIPMASLANPSLTTMGYDLNELGRLSAHKLMRLIRGEEKILSTLQLKTHLLVRESA